MKPFRRGYEKRFPYFEVLLLFISPFIIYALAKLPKFDPSLSDKQLVRIYKQTINEMQKGDSSCGPGYCKRPETRHVDCGRVLRGDKSYTSTVGGENRIPIVENENLNMSCSAIIRRIRPDHLKWNPLRNGGVAFARIVYTDYEFVEKQIQMSWHPQNRFCFGVDNKSTRSFQRKMRQLAKCLEENVVVLPATLHFDSAGHNMNLGHVECMKRLLQFPDWTYSLLLQNHDLVTKSVYELSRIYELLGGANDVLMSTETKGRSNSGMKWDPRHLKLFRNETGIPNKILEKPMFLSSGFVEGSLSREAVDWLINKVDVSTFINQYNQAVYGGDEEFISSFQINSQLGMPGHFTDECINQGIPVGFITRFSRWTVSGVICASGASRHELCIFGIEDFRAISKIGSIVFNKVIPIFDYTVVDCTAELLYNRTFLGQVDQKLDEELYETMVPVVYHKNHQDLGYTLNCTTSYVSNKMEYEDILKP